MSNTHGEWLDRIKGNKRKDKSTGEWNLGDGLPNVVNSVRRKLRYAGFQLEDRERTIINVDSYEVTVLVWALREYMERKGANHAQNDKHEYERHDKQTGGET